VHLRCDARFGQRSGAIIKEEIPDDPYLHLAPSRRMRCAWRGPPRLRYQGEPRQTTRKTFAMKILFLEPYERKDGDEEEEMVVGLLMRENPPYT
jgi:hypothetical protein